MKPFQHLSRLTSAALMLWLALAGVSAAESSALPEPLEQAFAAPPPSARPWVYWMWMDGNLSRAGLSADLEAMARAGIGGVIIMEVNVGIPRGPVKFMSPEWRQLFKHVVSEAERLGLVVTLNAGPGWTGSGGPWVKPEQSMQHLVASTLEVTGPTNLLGPLPRPQRRRPFFGDGALPPELEKAKNEFYRDVSVLAFPTPAANQRIGDINEKALYVRAPYSSQPGVKAFLPAPADYPAWPAGSTIDPGRVVDLSARLGADGRLDWQVPAGRWTILRFGRTTTGANTRPAPVPGLGLECDKMDAAALDAHFEQFIGTLLRELGPRDKSGAGGWKFLHIDSWEMSSQNWTASFREEFRRRRGYDLLQYLPTLTGRAVGSLEISERFLWDLRQTAQELMIENHAEHLKALGHREGLGLSIEPYDMMPCADMSFGAVADVPMCEFWLYGFNTTFSSFEAASIAHTCGRPIVAAESFTSSDQEHWQAYPGSMKALGDWAFSAGVNRLVFHRYQHQPWLDKAPGMTMGPYGVHWERTQTWWDMVPAYHEYLARCQYMLRQGLPVADVCFLVAEGAPHVFRPPPSATEGSPPQRLGYNFDGCAPETLLARMSVKDGRLVLPEGTSYRVLVLPEEETMTPRLLRKLKELVAAGATVIGPPPRKSPSLSGYPECDAEVSKLALELWAQPDGRKNGRVEEWNNGKTPVGPGSAFHDSKGTRTTQEQPQYGDYAVVTTLLRQMGLPPDFESSSGPTNSTLNPQPSTLLRYAHRRDGEMDLYFVANPESRLLQATCWFRVSDKQPELWDPLTGQTRRLPQFRFEAGRTAVPMRFEANQSFFLVFRHAPGARQAGPNFPEVQPVEELGGAWEVSFDPKRGGPAHVSFPKLEDWSRRPEPGIRYYSGIGIYRKTFDLPLRRRKAEPAGRTLLDLGEGQNVARVRLNGHELGVVWCAPWRVDITPAVQPRGNRLEVEVANLWPNRLIGDEQFPADCEFSPGGNLARWPDWLLQGLPRPSRERLAFTTWKHFGKNDPLLPSGLLGPVRVCREAGVE